MKGLSKGVELLEFGKDPEDSSWYCAGLAVDGIPCVPFSFGANEITGWTEEQLGQFLERMARVQIENFGDRRCPRVSPDLAGMEEAHG